MPTRQKHRGQHSSDKDLFKQDLLPQLRKAVSDLSWLLSNGYSEKSALKLVGDKFRFKERQRKAIRGAACSDAFLAIRKKREVQAAAVQGATLHIDGFNLLINIECALSKGLLMVGRDGAIRDLASIHGSYKRVEETMQALLLIGQTLAQLQPAQVIWYFDSPVSNSGRLKTRIRELAEAQYWNWKIELVYNPDTEIVRQAGIAVSSDAIVLNEAAQWFNLSAYVVKCFVSDALFIHLSD